MKIFPEVLERHTLFLQWFSWCLLSHTGSGGVLSLSALRQAGELHFPVLASSLHLKCWSVFTHMQREYHMCNINLSTLFNVIFWWCFFFFSSFAAHFEAKEAGDLSTLFDVGGIVGKR